jgi:hypothetical protein
VDSGSSANFISPAALARIGLDTEPSPNPSTITLADGSQHTSAELAHVPLRVQAYVENIPMSVLPLGSEFDIILGTPWLQYHNPMIDWRRCTVVFKHRGRVHKWTPPPEPHALPLLEKCDFTSSQNTQLLGLPSK